MTTEPEYTEPGQRREQKLKKRRDKRRLKSNRKYLRLHEEKIARLGGRNL